MRILITGFEPNDEGLNASEKVIVSMQNDLPETLTNYRQCIDFKVMPGDTNRLGQIVEGTLSKTTPDICIGIGQARGYNQIALERMAKNLRYFTTPDKAGNTPKGESIIPDAPVAYWSTLPEQNRLVSLLRSQNIPVRISNDCGTHLCNQIFYHFLHWQASHNANMKVGFVHIPALPEQVIQHWPESPFMPMAMTRQALSLIISQQLK